MNLNLFTIAALFLVAAQSSFVFGQTHNEHDHSSESHSEPKLTTPQTEHSDDKHSDQEHAPEVTLTKAQIMMADIVIETVTSKILDYEIYAPAEVKANGYTTYLVSPRVDSVVVQRHVSLGEHVEKNQPLVTLFSASVAQAQADYRINFAEWHRVQKLVNNTVSEKEKTEAQTRYIAALASLRAFGLTEVAIKKVTQDNASALGEYTLVATQAGSVLNDNFQQGQRVEAGGSLLTLADEHELWVEAKLSANARFVIPKGSAARVSVVDTVYPASVIQEAHTIDPITRTRIVRLSVQNTGHQLHSGMFADCYFKFKTSSPIMAVPESALIRSPDGDWVVYVEDEPGSFAAIEVELGRTLGRYREIFGLESGLAVVTQGTFFIASEQAKSGFDPHNH